MYEPRSQLHLDAWCIVEAQIVSILRDSLFNWVHLGVLMPRLAHVLDFFLITRYSTVVVPHGVTSSNVTISNNFAIGWYLLAKGVLSSPSAALVRPVLVSVTLARYQGCRASIIRSKSSQGACYLCLQSSHRLRGGETTRAHHWLTFTVCREPRSLV